MAMRVGEILSVGIGALCVLTAATALAAGQWSDNVTITYIEIDDASTGTSVYLGFNRPPSGKPACSTSSQALVSGSADYVKAITALATTAYLEGRSVQVYWDGTCASGYARIKAMSVGGGI